VALRKPKPDHPRVISQSALTASGTLVNLKDPSLTQRLAAAKSPWQSMAWDYVEQIGELGKAFRVIANVVSKVQFVAAEINEDDDEPILLTSEQCTLSEQVKKAARDALAPLPFDNGFAFQGTISQCFGVGGECWLWGRSNKDGSGGEEWQALSTDEVQVVSSGGLGVITTPGLPPEPIDTDTDTLIRLWVPNARWKQLATSPMRSMLDTCEDVILVGRELRAAARSRIMRNGVVLVSTGMTIAPQSRGEDGDPDNEDDFQDEFNTAMTAPIMNEGHPGMVVPLVLQGDPEDLKVFRHVTFQREDSPTLIGKQEAGLGRLADGLDMPSDMLKGVAGVNHWTGWLLDSQNFKNHMEPGVRLIADSLTDAYLRRTMVKFGGVTPEEAKKVRVWYDASNVTETANRAQDAKDAYDRGLISSDKARTDLGYNDNDKPSEEDLRILFALKSAADPTTMSQLLQMIVGTKFMPNIRETITVPERPNGTPLNGPDSGQPAAPGQVPNVKIPTTIPKGVAASAGRDGYRVVTNDALADLDNALLDKLTVAADMAILRAMEKAGARVRSAAQHSDWAARLRNVDPENICPMLGRDEIMDLGLSEELLIGRAFTALAGRFTAWSTATVKAAVKTAAKLFGLPLTTQANLTRVMLSRLPAAWSLLQDRLETRVLDKLYGRAGDELRGEVPESIVTPGDLRDALAHIGGSEPGTGDGIGLGKDVTAAIRAVAGPEFGTMWSYGTEPRNTFEPHAQLDDHRFNSATDERLATGPDYAWCGPYFHPGDHRGCRCHMTSAWLFPENARTMPDDVRQLMASTVGTQTQAMAQIRALAEMDDAAGRAGTTAQRERDERDRIVRLQAEWLEAA